MDVSLMEQKDAILANSLRSPIKLVLSLTRYQAVRKWRERYEVATKIASFISRRIQLLGMTAISELWIIITVYKEEDLEDLDESGFSHGVGFEIFGSADASLPFGFLRSSDKSVDDGNLTFEPVGLGSNK